MSTPGSNLQAAPQAYEVRPTYQLGREPLEGALNQNGRFLMDAMQALTGKAYHAVQISCVIICNNEFDPAGSFRNKVVVVPSDGTLNNTDLNERWSIPNVTIDIPRGAVDHVHSTLKSWAVTQTQLNTGLKLSAGHISGPEEVEGIEMEFTIARVFEIEKQSVPVLVAAILVEINFDPLSTNADDSVGLMLEDDVEEGGVQHFDPVISFECIRSGFICRKVKEVEREHRTGGETGIADIEQAHAPRGAEP